MNTIEGIQPEQRDPAPVITNLARALQWYEFGLSVIPLSPDSKRTSVTWDTWLEGLTEELVVEFWTRYPDHMVGHILGPDLLMLDADSPQSLAVLHQIEASLDATPRLVCQTSKGEHHYFKRAPGTYAHNCGFTTETSPDKIDVRTGRGMAKLHGLTDIVEVEHSSELSVVGQDFIDAIWRRNGKDAPRQIPPKASNGSDLPMEKDAVNDFLACIKPEALDYDEWLHVGMALQDEMHEAGLEMWDSWSQSDPRYQGTDDLLVHWSSFESGGGRTFGTIIHLAEKTGADTQAIRDKYDIFNQLIIPETEELKDKTVVERKTLKMPSDLASVDGMVGEIAAYAMASSTQPQPALALLSGLAAVSALAANRYVVAPWGTRLNLYGIAVAYTGAGKDRPAKVMAEVAKMGGLQVWSKSASGAALEAGLSESPALVLWLDEVWSLIKAANSKGANNHADDLRATLMSMYSSAGDSYNGKLYADSAKNIGEISHPYVVFTGATTPSALADALSVRQVDDGFLNRLLVFQSHDVPVPDAPQLMEMTPELHQKILAFTKRLGGAPRKPRSIQVTDDAKVVAKRLSQRQVLEIGSGKDYGALWSRATENALKVAGLVSLGMDTANPTVTVERMQWATKLVVFCIESMTDLVEEKMAEGEFDSLRKRTLAVIADPLKYVADKEFEPLLSKGYMPHSKLLRQMHKPVNVIDEVIRLLEGSGLIEVGTKGGKKVYRIKTDNG